MPFSEPSASPPEPLADAPSLPPLSAVGTVLVLGARGRLGYACVQAFAQAGWRVLAQVRVGSALAHSAASSNAAGLVAWQGLDLQDCQGWDALMQAHGPIDVIVNALAPSATSTSWAADWGVIAQFSTQLARKAQALLLQPASVLPYGRDLPAVLHENDVMPIADTITSRIGAVQAHNELQWRMAAESGVQVCLLRSGALYGAAGAGWHSNWVMERLPQGRFAWLGPYNVPTPWAYVVDVAQTLERIATQRHQLGVWTRLHMAGHQRCGHDWLQALQTIARQHGWVGADGALREQHVPGWLMVPMGWFSARLRAQAALQYVWRRPHQLHNAKLRALIGAEPHTAWEQSLRQTVDRVFAAAA